MTGKNITFKEMMQYMIAKNAKEMLEGMLREAGYEIGYDAGQVMVDSVTAMVHDMEISTSMLEKGDEQDMSKEHPYGYYYRLRCLITARTKPARRCDEDVYLRSVYVAGYAGLNKQDITMIWDEVEGDPRKGDVLWSESTWDRHEYKLDGKFDPFKGKSMTAGINDPEEEDVEEQVETAETETETADVEETEAEHVEAEETENEMLSMDNAEHRQKLIQAYGMQEMDDDDLAFGLTWLLPEEFEDAAKEAAGKYVAEMLHKAYEYTTAVGWGSSRNVADDGDAERYNLVYVSIQGSPEVVGADVMPDAFKWMTTLPEHKMYKVLVDIRHHYDVQAKTLAVYIAADRTGTMRHSIWDVKTGKLMFWSPVWAQEYGEHPPKIMPIFTAFRWREEHFEYKNYQDLFVHMDITLARKLGLLDDPEENETDIWA